MGPPILFDPLPDGSRKVLLERTGQLVRRRVRVSLHVRLLLQLLNVPLKLIELGIADTRFAVVLVQAFVKQEQHAPTRVPLLR